MTVALLIQRPSPNSSSLVPIAGEATFRDHWFGLAVSLGLQWIPQFQTGRPVPIALLPEVIAEFESIESVFRHSGLPDLADRAAGAGQALQEVLEGEPDAQVFIG